MIIHKKFIIIFIFSINSSSSSSFPEFLHHLLPLHVHHPYPTQPLNHLHHPQPAHHHQYTHHHPENYIQTHKFTYKPRNFFNKNVTHKPINLFNKSTSFFNTTIAHPFLQTRVLQTHLLHLFIPISSSLIPTNKNPI